MSIKNLFNNQKNYSTSSVASFEDVESSFLVDAVSENKKRDYLEVDFSDFRNFAKFGSAKKYFSGIVDKVCDIFPYDGTLAERQEFKNGLSQYEAYVFDNLYPTSSGYVSFAAEDWGGTSTFADGFGSSSSPEYIKIYGGANVGNVFNSGSNLESNLKCEFDEGFSFEFWMKKNEFASEIVETEKEVIYHLWDEEKYSRFLIYCSGSIGNPKGLYIHYQSGNGADVWTNQINQQIVLFSTASLADDAWHHYGLTFATYSSGFEIRSYFDGSFYEKVQVSKASPQLKISGSLIATIGAHGNTSGSVQAGYGKIRGSFDEFRFWKETRNPKEIHDNRFRCVGGGSNSATSPNRSLGLYYKFNEGVTGTSSIDSVVLDYSGRVSNGTFVGFQNGYSRDSGSAIYSALGFYEEKEPIIYKDSHFIQNFLETYLEEAEAHDTQNGSCMINNIPAWIVEEDEESQTLANFLHTIGAYFDTAYLQIKSLSVNKNINYKNYKVSHAIANLLQGEGFELGDFINSFDEIAQNFHVETKDSIAFEKTLAETKNQIFKNIYNNLVFINKSKGTEKSFRNLLRCFGIDEDIVNINIYQSGFEDHLKDQRSSRLIKKPCLDFSYGNDLLHRNGTAYLYSTASLATDSHVGWITSSSVPLDFSMECFVRLPKEVVTTKYKTETSTQNFSLFGTHNITAIGNYAWASTNNNFHAYVQKTKTDCRFYLSSSMLSSQISSSIFEHVFENDFWNLNVQVYNEKPVGESYVIKFSGVRPISEGRYDSFEISGSLSNGNFLKSGLRSIFAGAHKTNFDGTTLMQSNIYLYSVKCWNDNCSFEEIKNRSYDASSSGRSANNVFSTSSLNIPKYDSLILDWTFDTTEFVPSAAGIIADCSRSDEKYGTHSFNLNKLHPGIIHGLDRETVKISDFIEINKPTLPDRISKEDIEVRDFDDLEFSDLDVENGIFVSVESSMNARISEKMMNFLDSRKRFSDFISPIDRYRREYKALKHFSNLFFEKVDEVANFERYIDVYRVIESAIESIISNVFPVSVKHSDQIKFILENNSFSRNKIQHSFKQEKFKPPIAKSISNSSNPYVVIKINETGFSKELNIQDVANIKTFNYEQSQLLDSPDERYIPGSVSERGFYFNRIVDSDGNIESFTYYVPPRADKQLYGTRIGSTKGRREKIDRLLDSSNFANASFADSLHRESGYYQNRSYQAQSSTRKNAYWEHAERHNSSFSSISREARVQIHDNQEVGDSIENGLCSINGYIKTPNEETQMDVQFLPSNFQYANTFQTLQINVTGRYLQKDDVASSPRNILKKVEQ